MSEDGGSSGATVRVERAGDEKAAEDQVQKALQTGAVGEAAGLPEHLQHLKERNQAQEIELRQRFAEQEYELRRKYARGILVLLAVQFVVANSVFIAFAWAGKHWDLSTAVIDVWLAATVVQVVGIVLVVTRHLFPDRVGKPTWF
ncbi:MAG TPA: hypothetical protein VNP96_02955 [Solirubrobacterales bacterium]|nr:hypothetical protein [Solirubrobacterales bacterium]